MLRHSRVAIVGGPEKNSISAGCNSKMLIVHFCIMKQWCIFDMF